MGVNELSKQNSLGRPKHHSKKLQGPPKASFRPELAAFAQQRDSPLICPPSAK